MHNIGTAEVGTAVAESVLGLRSASGLARSPSGPQSVPGRLLGPTAITLMGIMPRDRAIMHRLRFIPIGPAGTRNSTAITPADLGRTPVSKLCNGNGRLDGRPF